jgi:hypothetical protein
VVKEMIGYKKKAKAPVKFEAYLGVYVYEVSS